MLKKVLLVIMALFITGGLLVIYGTYKAVDVAIEETIKEHEPQLRQYMQMSEADQNKYVLEYADKILTEGSTELRKPEDRANAEALAKTKNDPEVQQALIKLGRSVMSKAIMHSETLVKEMRADAKLKYQKESDNLRMNFENYLKLVEAADAHHKAA